MGISCESKGNAREVFHYVLRLYTVRLNESKLAELDNRLVSGIHMAVKNFQHSPEVVEGANEYYSRDALQAVIDICEAEKTYLTDQVFIVNQYINLQELIHWKMGADTIYRRQLLRKCLIKYFKNHGMEPPGSIITITGDLIKA